jgi:hypothetical protein
MAAFPHLPLPKKITAPHKFTGVPIEVETAQETIRNLRNRQKHGKALKNAITNLSKEWDDNLKERRENNLPDLPDEAIVPVLLKVDINLFNTDSLYSLGIDVVAEDKDGYIIGASVDNFKSLQEKIDKFINEEGKYKDKAAQLWEIANGDQWRIDHILSPELNAKWDKITDGQVLIVDISVACDVKIPNEPIKKKGESERNYLKRYKAWQERKEALESKRYEMEEKRQDEVLRFLQGYGAATLSDFISYNDSFCCRIEVSGLALKDLVRTYQYLFDVTEYDVLVFEQKDTGQTVGVTSNILPPDPGSPVICVIDSGIQEQHPLLMPGIDVGNSKSYLPNDNSYADAVPNGGHGTKVAGAILFGNHIPKNGQFKLDCFVSNARVLNARNNLPKELFPPALMEEIVKDYADCKIFNLSVSNSRPCRLIHMSKWAASIDKLMSENDKLFIVCAGNIKRTTGSTINPGIIEHINARRSYPNYLYTNAARISDPAQSCFALTVGSLCIGYFEDQDRQSFGKKDMVSSFSRCGPGIWRMIKPDIVEYGGDFIREKGANPNLSVTNATMVEVVSTTAGGANAIGYDLGTSFATPKVAHIAAAILKNIPAASSNLMRTLIVQSARLPGVAFQRPQVKDIQAMGYGIPDKVRATENSESRITLIAEDRIRPRQAQVYTIKIPDEIRSAGNEFDILVEVTVAFMAKPRRTRQRTNNYLSTWVDWQSSKFEESYLRFRKRVTNHISEEEDNGTDNIDDLFNDERHFEWKIRENVNWGSVKGLRRQDSSIQKDWAIVKSFSLPEEFSIAVVGHKGWEKDTFQDIPYSIAVSLEVLEGNVEIYNKIRVENEIEIEQEL